MTINTFLSDFNLEKLDFAWCRCPGMIRNIFNQPIDEINDYFGTKISFYFAFLEFYNRALAIPAIIALLVTIAYLFLGRNSLVRFTTTCNF